MGSGQEALIHVLISLSVLLFAAKLLAELFNKLRLPSVLGELLAGIMVGPFDLDSIPIFDGKPLVILNETVRQIGELAGIVILFIAGLEITPREFLSVVMVQNVTVNEYKIMSNVLVTEYLSIN